MKKWALGTLALSLCWLLLLTGCGGAGSTSQKTQALAITSSAPPSGTTGIAYGGSGFALTASGGVAPYNWSWAAATGSTLPQGLAVGNGMISGTATNAGSFKVVITVTDSQSPPAQKNTPYTITITAGALVITSAAPPSGTVGADYATGGFSLTASGGSTPYTWSWAAASGSALPPGLTVANGTISGTPTAASTYNVVITVTDSQSPAVQTSNDYSITIAKPAALAITSRQPPAGIVGNTYSPHFCGIFPRRPCNGFPLTASGGVAPYTWNWAGAQGSSTPPGLLISSFGFGSACSYLGWKICGVPSTAGTYHVVITVADSATPQNHTSAPYSITINNPPPPIITVTPIPTAAINLPYSFTFTATAGRTLTLTWGETGALPSGVSLATTGVLSGTPTVTGSFPITVTVVDSLNQSSAPVDFTIVIAPHGFKATGSMANQRASHTATLLPNGRVLVAGGTDSSGNTATTEIYDPIAGSFSPANTMTIPRSGHTATLLKDGQVLITGGGTNTAEIYDPSSGNFVATGSMQAARDLHTATLLQDGRVLVTGGQDPVLISAEIYDPATGTFTSTGNMTAARSQHAATLLSNGKVLVTGGIDNNDVGLNSAELFDPATGHFSATGTMTAGRAGLTSTLLNNNTVLIAGGVDPSSNTSPVAAEIYNPATGTFSATSSLSQGVFDHTATLLPNGQVLVAGGIVPNGVGVFTAEVFDPAAGTFTATGSLITPRYQHTATLLNDGTVLVVGGRPDGGQVLNTAELYQ